MAAWNERHPPSSGGVSSLTDLADVSVLSPLEGDILVYDETTGRWLNETPLAPEAAVNIHNDLTGIQGGATAEYYHLTSAEVTKLNSSQPLLVSGTNIKTVNGNTLVGSGDLIIEATVKMPFYTAAGNYDSISLVGTDRLPFFLANGSANNILMVT